MEVSIFTHKYTLVPKQFFTESRAEELLSEVARLESGEEVKSIALEELGAVLVYSLTPSQASTSSLPEIYYMLQSLGRISEYNKIVCSHADGYIHLVIAQGRTLLLACCYQASDFTTAQYYLFAALKKLQLNPEMSTVFFRSSLTEDEKMSLYRYFSSVEAI